MWSSTGVVGAGRKGSEKQLSPGPLYLSGQALLYYGLSLSFGVTCYTAVSVGSGWCKKKVTLTGRLINNIYFPSLEAGKSKVKVLVELESGRPSWMKTEQKRKRWAGAGLGVSKTEPPRSAGAPQDGTGQASPATVGSLVVLGGPFQKH